MSKRKKKIFDIIQIGNKEDYLSKSFDIFIVLMIMLNLFITLFDTFDQSIPYKNILNVLEFITIIIFTIEYALRVWTASYLYPSKSVGAAKLSFITSFYGIIDLLTILPYYMMLVFPENSFPVGAVAFRLFRVIRIFRLFKINVQYDAFNVITSVLKEKKNQLISSMSLILIFMTASSLCMYGLEHDAQPEQFKNAFSGIWWSVSTLLTVGYGDIYPITVGGRIMAIVISFLGVGMVAIPTGIISAGFVEQYPRFKFNRFNENSSFNYITYDIDKKSQYVNKRTENIDLPMDLEPVMILRNDEFYSLAEIDKTKEKDILIISTKDLYKNQELEIREELAGCNNDYEGVKVKNIDILRREKLVMIRREGHFVQPTDEMKIRRNDGLIICSKHKN